MILLLASPAHAWAPGDVEVVPFEGQIAALTALDLDGDGVLELAVATPDSLWVGEAQFALEANALATGPGKDALVACTADGVVLLEDDALVSILAQPCSDLVYTDLDDDGDLDLVTAGDDGVWAWLADGDHWTEDVSIALPGATLVPAGNAVLGGLLGEQALFRLTLDDVFEDSAAGPIGGLAAPFPSYSLPSNSGIVAGGSFVDLGVSPGAMVSDDVTGNGLTEHIVLYADGVSVVEGGEAVAHPLTGAGPQGPEQVLLRDLDDDDCPELLLAVGDEVHIYAGTECISHLDLDGDGTSPAEGDCDDFDVQTFPGADELCDEVDNDCDGQVDEGEVSVLDTELPGAEGDEIALAPQVEGCPAGFRFASPDEAWLSCEDAACRILDDGTAEIEVEALDDKGAMLATGTLVLHGTNLPPILDATAIPEVVLRPGQSMDLRLLATDPSPTDPLTWSHHGAPPGLSIDGGTFFYTASAEHAGSWQIDVTVADDDGGRAQGVVLVTVQARERQCGCVHAPPSWCWLVALLALVRRRA